MSENGHAPEVLTCEGCGALCCKHVSVELARPTCKRDYDEVIWFLLHKGVSVYIDHDGDWNVEFETECEALDGEDCTIYGDRPRVCADYEIDSCVRYGDGPYYEVRWSTKDEFIAWLESEGIDWRYKRGPGGAQRTRRPLLVQIRTA